MWIEAFDLDTPIKLPSKVETPLGSKVSVVNLCVDVQYEVRDRQIVIKQARISSRGRPGPSGQMCNVKAARLGEVWYARQLPISRADLLNTIEQEIALSESNLRRRMIAKWLDGNGSSIAQPVIDALNARQSATEIEALIRTAGRGHRISFTYDSPQRGPERRVVILRGASGNSIRATDTKDDDEKNFRIDRIINVQLER